MDIFGYIAAFLTTISFVPQLTKVIKTKDTQSLSLSMYAFLTTGVFLWVLHGLYKNDFPVVLANSAIFLMALIILFYKWKNDVYKRGKENAINIK